MKILTILGARPQFIKAGSVSRAIASHNNQVASLESLVSSEDSKNQELKTIICEADVFASCFFMLTRWEEYVNKNRDKHDRFSANESLAYKQGFFR
mgnify:CR=1 FL=1